MDPLSEDGRVNLWWVTVSDKLEENDEKKKKKGKSFQNLDGAAFGDTACCGIVDGDCDNVLP